MNEIEKSRIKQFAEVRELVLIPAEEFERESLKTIADWINNGHSQMNLAVRRLAVHVAQIGAWIVAAKAKCKHGEFLLWLEDNCSEIHRATAWRYMEIYHKAMEISNLALMQHMTPNEAYKALGIIKDNNEKDLIGEKDLDDLKPEHNCPKCGYEW